MAPTSSATRSSRASAQASTDGGDGAEQGTGVATQAQTIVTALKRPAKLRASMVKVGAGSSPMMMMMMMTMVMMVLMN